MTATANPFAPAEFDEGVPRDGRGRPLIVPAKRDGTPNLSGKLAAYTRASTFAKALDDGSGLTRWKLRHAVLGVAISPDLAAMAGALGRNVNRLSDEDKRNLDAIVERAHDRSGGNEKADYGTAVHAMTEPDREPFIPTANPFAPAEPPTYAGDVAAYETLLAQLGVEVVATETFVVNDELKAAGTFDHAYRFTRDLCGPDGAVVIPAGTVVIGDKKTGTLHLGQHAIQLAIYARGRVYEHETGERSALDVSPKLGVVVHIPKGAGVALVYVLDLHAGWEGAKLAGKVRAYRSAERKLSLLKVEAEPVEAEPASVTEHVEQIREDVAALAAVTDTPAQLVEVPEPEPAPPAEPEPAPAAATPPAGVDAFGDPIPDPTLSESGAMANLARAGMLADDFDVIDRAIREAKSGADCRALWGQYRQSWQDKHTEAVKARLGELGEVPAA